MLPYLLSFIYLPKFCGHVLFHQDTWTVKTAATLNSKRKSTTFFFMDLTKIPMVNHIRDYSARWVRNPLLKVWSQLFIAYYCYWEWGFSHWLSDACAQVRLWTETHCRKNVYRPTLPISCVCHPYILAADLELLGPSHWGLKEMNMFLLLWVPGIL